MSISLFQSRFDTYRIFFYDVVTAMDGTGKTHPELYLRHNAVPGMFLVSNFFFVYSVSNLQYFSHVILLFRASSLLEMITEDDITQIVIIDFGGRDIACSNLRTWVDTVVSFHTWLTIGAQWGMNSPPNYANPGLHASKITK